MSPRGGKQVADIKALKATFRKAQGFLRPAMLAKKG